MNERVIREGCDVVDVMGCVKREMGLVWDKEGMYW
jgi:hypothetical protein